MRTGDVVLYAVVVAVFLAVILLSSLGVTARVVRAERARDISFSVALGACGVVGIPVAHRVISGAGPASYLYVFGLPVAGFAVMVLTARLVSRARPLS